MPFLPFLDKTREWGLTNFAIKNHKAVNVCMQRMRSNAEDQDRCGVKLDLY